MNPAGLPAQTGSAESGAGRAHSAHPLILIAVAAVLVALVLLVAGFVAGSTALLWAAVAAAAVALSAWVAERRAARDRGNDPASAGPAIGLLGAQRGPTGD